MGANGPETHNLIENDNFIFNHSRVFLFNFVTLPEHLAHLFGILSIRHRFFSMQSNKLGALFPYNTLITAVDYFRFVFPHQDIEFLLPLCLAIPNLVMYIPVIFFGGRFRYNDKISTIQFWFEDSPRFHDVSHHDDHDTDHHSDTSLDLFPDNPHLRNNCRYWTHLVTYQRLRIPSWKEVSTVSQDSFLLK